MMVIVKNNGAEKFAGPSVRYDGKSYEFPPGKAVTVPSDAARHIFGLGLSDKTSIFVRHGWIARASDHDRAMDKLNQFSFEAPEAAHDLPQVERDAEQDDEHGTAPVLTGTGGGPEADEEGTPSVNATEAGGSMLDDLGV